MTAMPLRDRMKGGTFSPVYRVLRQWKRRIRREPPVGNVPLPIVSLPLEALLPLAPQLEDQARYHFSLALAHLESWETLETARDKADLTRALECLDRAEALHFEAADRLALYRAVCFDGLGERDKARELTAPLTAYELTEPENALRARLLAPDNVV